MIYYQSSEEENELQKDQGKNKPQADMIYFDDGEQPDSQEKPTKQKAIEQHQFKNKDRLFVLQKPVRPVKLDDKSLKDNKQEVKLNEQNRSHPNELSSSLVRALLNHGDIRILVYTPIPSPTKFQFRVLRNKSMFNSNYKCYLYAENKEVLLMQATKEGSLINTKYRITLARQLPIQGDNNLVGFIHKEQLTYEFVDDGQSKIKMNDNMIRRMGSARIIRDLFTKDIQILTPQVRDHQVPLIDANEFSKLFNLATISTYQQKLYIYQSISHNDNVFKMIKNKLQFLQSDSNLMLEKINNQNSEIKLILGKIADNSFRMSVGHGMSPFQAFCMVVVWFEA